MQLTLLIGKKKVTFTWSHEHTFKKLIYFYGKENQWGKRQTFNTLCHKKMMHPEKINYSHETSHVYSVWGDKRMIKNLEQKIILLSSYGIKKVKNQ